MMKRAIVVASFGVADAAARKHCLDVLAEEIADAHPDYDVVQAYTSAFLRKRLQKEGVSIPSLEERMEELSAKGYGTVLIQPSHLTPGEEYSNKVLGAARAFQGRFSSLLVGEPLFFLFREDGGRDDYSAALEAVWQAMAIPSGEELVLLGHGSPHRHNPVYERLQARADKAGFPIHIGVVEESDTPNFSMVTERLRKRGGRNILLAPLLLSGGVHVTEDMAGDSPSSWKSRLEAEGLSVRTSCKGLGEYPGIRKLYLGKVERLVELAEKPVIGSSF